MLSAEVMLCRVYQSCLFLRGNAGCGTAKVAVLAQANFCKNKRLFVPQYQIDFPKTAPIVSFKQLKPLLLQESGRHLFGIFPESVH